MNTICVHFARGTCRFGSDCYKSHEISSPTSSPKEISWRRRSSQSLSPPSSPRFSSFVTPQKSREPCRFFNRGTCWKGVACPFSHSQSPESSDPQVRPFQSDSFRKITEVEFQNRNSLPSVDISQKRKLCVTTSCILPRVT